MLKFATGGTFFIELILPFLIFCPRRLRFFAAFGILLLQSCILHHRQLQLVQSPDHAAVPAAVRRRGAAKDIAAAPAPAVAGTRGNTLRREGRLPSSSAHWRC